MSVQVLVADDEALIRQSLRATLVREGFDVSVAASGNEAWLRFQEDKPDVVLLDLVLGDVDGIDVLRRMRQEAPDAKVLVGSRQLSSTELQLVPLVGAEAVANTPCARLSLP